MKIFFSAFRRLNGWYRLYLSFLLFVLLPIAYLDVRQIKIDAPTPAELVSRLPKDTQQLIQEHEIKLEQKISKQNAFNALEYDFNLKGIPVVESDDKHTLIGITNQEEYVITYAKAIPTEVINQVKLEIHRTTRLLMDEWNRHRIWNEVFLPYLSIALGLAVFGHTIAWVRKGFKGN